VILPATTNDEKAVVLAYVASKIGTTPQDIVGSMPFSAIATLRGGNLLGGVIYTNYRVTSIEMSCAGEAGWLMPKDLRFLFEYPLIQLGCYTLLTSVTRRNERARKFNEKLGFEHLGVVESGLSKGDDTIVYKMTRPKCRWIGQPAASNVVPFPSNTASAGVAAHGSL
jgi:hypothetical protein